MISRGHKPRFATRLSRSLLGEDAVKTSRLLLIAVGLAVIIASGDVVWAFLDAASVDAPPRLHNPIVAPVELTVDYGPERQVPPVRISRVSPRGIRSEIGGRERFFERAAVFSDLEISAQSEILAEVDHVELRIGKNTHTISGDRIRNAAEQTADNMWAVSLRGTTGLSAPGSLISPLQGVLNYRGDFTVIFWLLVRTFFSVLAILGVWRLYLAGRVAEKGNAGRSFAWAWLALGVLAVVLSRTWLSRPLIVSDLASAVYLGVLVWVLISGGTVLRSVWTPEARYEVSPLNGALGGQAEQAERWPFLFGLLGLFAMAVTLRVWNLHYMQGNDTFNLTAALALNETGSFAYTRNTHLTHLIAFVVRTFGRSLDVVRIPFVLISLVAMAGIGYLASKLGKRTFWLALLLYAVSPVAIEHASTIREYGENLLVATGLLCALVAVFVRMRSEPLKAAFWMTVFVLVSSVGVLLYGDAVANGPIQAVPQVVGFTYVSMMIVLAWRFLTSYRPWIVLATALGFSVVALFAPAVGPFGSEFSLPVNFLRVYFDPFHFRQMQWFSFQAFTPLIPAAIVLTALAGPRNRDLGVAFSLALWGSLLLFSLRSGDTAQGRYVYHLFPLYVTLFAAGLAWLWSALKQSLRHSSHRRVTASAFIIGCLCIIWPINTAIAARHDVPADQDRRVTSLSPKDKTYALYKILKEHGLSPDAAVVVENDQPDNFSWVLDRPVTSTYQMSRTEGRSFTRYDAARGVYHENPDKYAFGLRNAVQANKEGFYLHEDRPGRIPEIEAAGTRLSFVTSAHGYTIYRW